MDTEDTTLLLGPGRPALEDPLKHVGATQRRVAQLKAAGMTIFDIARFMQCSEEKISAILSQTRVQNLILKLGAMAVDDIRPAVEEVNTLMAATLKEAFQVEIDLMKRTYERHGDIKSETLCHQVASSLLDRGGVAAPKRFESKNLSLNLGADNINTIANVLKELDDIE